MKFRIAAESFEHAVDRARQQIVAQGLRVVADVPTSELVNATGFEVPRTQQLFFFRADFMHALIRDTDEGILLAPMKLVLRETANGAIEGLVSSPLARFADLPKVARFAALLEENVQAVVKALSA